MSSRQIFLNPFGGADMNKPEVQQLVQMMGGGVGGGMNMGMGGARKLLPKPTLVSRINCIRCWKARAGYAIRTRSNIVAAAVPCYPCFLSDVFRAAPKNWRSAFFRELLIYCMDPAKGVLPQGELAFLDVVCSAVRFVFSERQAIAHLQQTKKVLAWGADSQDWPSRLPEADDDLRTANWFLSLSYLRILRTMLAHVDFDDAEAWRFTDLEMLKRLRSQLKDAGRGDAEKTHFAVSRLREYVMVHLLNVIVDLQSRFLPSIDAEDGPGGEVVPPSKRRVSSTNKIRALIKRAKH